MNKNNHTPVPTIGQAIGTLAMLLTGIAILIIALVACTPQALTTEPTDLTGATPLRIGTLTIGNTPDAATRIGIDGGSFTTGDEIAVEAIYDDDDYVTATYTYTENNDWELAEGSDPIIVERIKANTKPIVFSYGGKVVPPDGYDYNNQSTEASYRYSDFMTSTTTTLNGRTLNAALKHTCVDIVVNITDALEDATLILKGGMNGTKDIKTWRTADATPTFRACVVVQDVPGFTDGNVPSKSLLGTLTYTLDGGTEQKTLNIRYTIDSGVALTPGMRITLSVPFSDLVGIGNATATVSPWNDTHAGEVGTAAIATATGLEALDESVFNAAHPVWIITGDGADEAKDNAILANVVTALKAVTTPASIRIFLTGFEGKIMNNAFANGGSGCNALASFSAPKATTIGSYAFNYCTALSSVTLPAATTIESYAFVGTALSTLNLPAVHTIESSAFYNCTSLTTVTLPAVRTIGNTAFTNCYALSRLELTQSTTPITLGTDVFLGSNPAANITLVLASRDPEVLNTIGVTVEGTTVTFLNGGATYTFKAIQYKDEPQPATN